MEKFHSKNALQFILNINREDIFESLPDKSI